MKPSSSLDAGRAPALDADLSHRGILEDARAALLRAAWPAPAWCRSGLVWPSLGRNMPPTRSSTASSGQRSLISPGDSTSIRKAERLAHRCAAQQFLEARGRRGDADRAVLAEARGLAGFGLERVVEIGSVFREFGQVARGAQLPDESRRVPRGAAGQALALEQHDVGDAELRQVIGDRTAGDSAADDHDVRAIGKRHYAREALGSFPVTPPAACPPA